jgi:hypothetical protein
VFGVIAYVALLALEVVIGAALVVVGIIDGAHGLLRATRDS